METLLDVEIRHEFLPSLKEAARRAAIEAANTGAAVLSVESIEVDQQRVTFIGTLPDIAVEMPGGRGISAPRARSLYTTWGAVFQPSGMIGYLVLDQPISCPSHPAEDPIKRRVGVSLRRSLNTVAPLILGPQCCLTCKRPIPEQRLLAAPGARLCVGCQRKKEEGENAIKRHAR